MEVIQVQKKDLLDLLRMSRMEVRKACYSTAEVMRIFNYKHWKTFMDYTNTPECYLRRVKGRKDQWTAKSVAAEMNRIDE